MAFNHLTVILLVMAIKPAQDNIKSSLMDCSSVVSSVERGLKLGPSKTLEASYD